VALEVLELIGVFRRFPNRVISRVGDSELLWSVVPIWVRFSDTDTQGMYLGRFSGCETELLSATSVVGGCRILCMFFP